MTNKEQIISCIKDMSMLCRSTAKYTYRRIMSSDNRSAYKTAMLLCISSIEEGWESIDIIKQKVNGHRSSIDDHLPQRWYNKQAENRRYFMMAIDHAMDVINSLEARFITGGHDSEPRIYRNRGGFIYEDEGVF